ncbi:hypothetical protein C8R34_1367 [Nitrosomonas sp. Nm84]|nr:hypothetical protein C8R34_1367 [Nitrosomonas sp. Nm84]
MEANPLYFLVVAKQLVIRCGNSEDNWSVGHPDLRHRWVSFESLTYCRALYIIYAGDSIHQYMLHMFKLSRAYHTVAAAIATFAVVGGYRYRASNRKDKICGIQISLRNAGQGNLIIIIKIDSSINDAMGISAACYR